jgi:hypothetical protein
MVPALQTQQYPICSRGVRLAEALVADVGEEKSLVDGDVGGVLIGGVGGALVGVPFPPHVRLATLLLVISFLLHLLPFLFVVHVVVTCI